MATIAKEIIQPHLIESLRIMCSLHDSQKCMIIIVIIVELRSISYIDNAHHQPSRHGCWYRKEKPQFRTIRIRKMKYIIIGQMQYIRAVNQRHTWWHHRAKMIYSVRWLNGRSMGWLVGRLIRLENKFLFDNFDRSDMHSQVHSSLCMNGGPPSGFSYLWFCWLLNTVQF